MNTEELFNRRDIQRRFDRAARDFDCADFVHQHTREGLLGRLDGVVVDATVVVDLGAATGAALRPLKKRFRGASVIAVDLARNMLERCKRRGTWISKPLLVQADAAQMPFADHSIDVVFSNMLLPWMADPARLGEEAARVLRSGGLFAFATLGPDSLANFAEAWADVDDFDHVPAFPDMHDLGDTMLRAGLRDPVLDVDRLVVTYEDTGALFRDLTAVGARNCFRNRRRSLTGSDMFANFRSRLEAARVDGRIRLEFELVYGHCWGSGGSKAKAEVHIAPHAIPIRSR